MPDNHRPVRADMKWDPQSDIVIKGYEWEDISGFLSMFQGAMIAYNAVTSRNIANGNIKVTYLYEDGTAVTPEELTRLQSQRLADYTEQLKAAQQDQKEK
jgi:hypothetical protein